MKSFTRLIGARRVLTNLNNGAIEFVGQPSGYSYQVVAPLSNKGNFKDPTGFSYSIRENFYLMGSHIIQDSSTGSNRQAKGNLQTPVQTPVWENRTGVYNLALNRLNDKVRGQLDLSVALAEAGTTKKMLKSTVAVLNHARKVRRLLGQPAQRGGRRKKIPSYDRLGTSRDLANGYLQFQYGWKPLLGDVFGAADEAVRFVQNGLQNIHGSAKKPEEREEMIYYPSLDGAPDVPVKRKIDETSFNACRIGIQLEIPTNSFDPARWTSMNPVTIGWELVPYSFVIDWFFDIGSYLRNVETACLYNLIFRRGYTSEISRYRFDDTIRSTAVKVGNVTHKFDEVEGEGRFITFERRLMSGYPFPRRPTVRVDLHSSQMFSAAALLRQIFDPLGEDKTPVRNRGRGAGTGPIFR